jgi:Flp pilus assembly pilin Flp
MSWIRSTLRRLLVVRRDTRGAISTEYVVLVGTIGLAAVFALVAVGPVLVQGFERSRNILTSPFP